MVSRCVPPDSTRRRFIAARYERLTGFSVAQRNRAADWFAQNNPFAGRDRKLQTAAR